MEHPMPPRVDLRSIHARCELLCYVIQSAVKQEAFLHKKIKEN
jgi:hypothetical protein